MKSETLKIKALITKMNKILSIVFPDEHPDKELKGEVISSIMQKAIIQTVSENSELKEKIKQQTLTDKNLSDTDKFEDLYNYFSNSRLKLAFENNFNEIAENYIKRLIPTLSGKSQKQVLKIWETR